MTSDQPVGRSGRSSAIDLLGRAASVFDLGPTPAGVDPLGHSDPAAGDPFDAGLVRAEIAGMEGDAAEILEQAGYSEEEIEQVLNGECAFMRMRMRQPISGMPSQPLPFPA
jgi:hypothetical protein